MWTCALGLIPYAYHYFHTESFIAYMVLHNGLLFHIVAPNNIIVKWYDITCNSVFIVYVNAYVLNFYVFMWSCFACTCYVCNSKYIKHEQIGDLIHIFGVQLPLYRALQLSNF